MNTFRNILEKISRNNPIHYIPRQFRKPPELLYGISAWKGLELIIADIISDFALGRTNCLEFGVESAIPGELRNCVFYGVSCGFQC